MLKKRLLCVLVCGMAILGAACEPIHEPWVRSQDQLAQERARPAAAQMELRHRFLEVQTDR